MKRSIPTALSLFVSGTLALWAQPADPSLYSGLSWRNLGPFRGGWSNCAVGVPDQPDTFFFGAAEAGVWRTDDAGETWTPLMDREPTAVVEALAIAPSDAKIIYVGTGQVAPRYDVASGRGVYRSNDGGKTWLSLGLEETRAIGRILVDPKNPDVVLVAALGHFFGPNPARGVFRSQDGGKTWARTLFVTPDTGVVDLAWDPDRPSVVYAAAWQARTFPWLSYFQPIVGPGSGLYKSTDGGKTWKRLAGSGWPTADLGRIGLAVAPGGRVFALVDAPASSAAPANPARPRAAGLYRSDDGGASWTQVNPDSDLASWYFGEVTLDPSRPDVLYVVGRSVQRSDDGGKTFRIVKGAPGGDDYHSIWINPKHPDHQILASDQGTVVTVNGGKTWSSWYNQPTGQFYHAATDDRFPYWIYSGQQDSGTAAIASRSDYGALSFRDWHPVGGEERGWDVPDPADPAIVYGTGLGGTLTRYDSRTGQVQNISPSVESTYGRRGNEVKYRFTWISPLVVSPRPPHALYFGAQVLFRSTDRGRRWTVISPDLTGAVPGTKGCDGPVTLTNARPCGFGVIYTIALSARSEHEIWIGTDDGVIQRTRDGGRSWSNVTPAGLPPWSKVASLDVSPFDPETAYAAIDSHRLDDFTPHAYRTRDGGKTWTTITFGLPSENFVTVVRADPARKGLLYAGTDAGVSVSFDDGDHWQSLQSNLPTTWVGDLAIHGNDLIAATQGRAIWVLDDVTPLRQVPSAASATRAYLYEPAAAIRVRANENRDTPLPPETPLGANPPPGAVIDYWMKSDSSSAVTLEILDSSGRLVHRESSEKAQDRPKASVYFAQGWLKPPPPLSASAGHHRVVWNLRYPRPVAVEYEYSIAAIFGEDTPVDPDGPLVVPGTYTARLSAAGETITRSFAVRMDPRVSISSADLARQLALARDVCAAMNSSADALGAVRTARERLKPRAAGPGAPSKAIADVDTALAALDRELSGSNRRMASLLAAVEGADGPPTAQAEEAWREWKAELDRTVGRWETISRGDLPRLLEPPPTR